MARMLEWTELPSKSSSLGLASFDYSVTLLGWLMLAIVVLVLVFLVHDSVRRKGRDLGQKLFLVAAPVAGLILFLGVMVNGPPDYPARTLVQDAQRVAYTLMGCEHMMNTSLSVVTCTSGNEAGKPYGVEQALKMHQLATKISERLRDAQCFAVLGRPDAEFVCSSDSPRAYTLAGATLGQLASTSLHDEANRCSPILTSATSSKAMVIESGSRGVLAVQSYAQFECGGKPIPALRLPAILVSTS